MNARAWGGTERTAWRRETPRVSMVLMLLAAAVAAWWGERGSAQPPSEPPGERETPILGAPAALPAERDGETIHIPAGAVLRSAPGARAAELGRAEVEMVLPVRRRVGSFVQVEALGMLVWVRGDGEPAADPGELDPDETTPFDPFDGRADPSERLLAEARLMLDAPSARRAAGVELLSDLTDKALLDAALRAAARVEDAYRARFGLEPALSQDTVVVVFAREEGYRRFARQTGAPLPAEAPGHAAPGFVALFAGERSEAEVLATLVHELTHTLNRRSFAAELPSCLEEGLAEALATSPTGKNGALDLAAVREARERRLEAGFDARGRSAVRRSVSVRGPRVALRRAASAWQGGVPDLDSMFEDGWELLLAGEARQDRYAECGFLVRFLLDGEREALAPGFRAWLRAVAAGGGAALGDLLVALAIDRAELARRFARWAGETAN